MYILNRKIAGLTQIIILLLGLKPNVIEYALQTIHHLKFT